MRIAFIVDPLDQLKAYKDSSVAMMRAAERHGHEVWALQPEVLHWSQAGGVGGEAVRLHTRADDH
ncbi:MAG TPA: glutathione synthase, partial [Azospira sp.]|nr:glutathione synthase [Azospira sp.]